MLATHHSKVPFVKGLAELASVQASKHGSIRALLGRRCRFHLWEPRTYGYEQPLPLEDAQKKHGMNLRRAFTYKALNKLIQGSAADQTKRAILDCYNEGLIPSITVHDELTFSVQYQKQASRITANMEHDLDGVRKVPAKEDVELGKKWGQVG